MMLRSRRHLFWPARARTLAAGTLRARHTLIASEDCWCRMTDTFAEIRTSMLPPLEEHSIPTGEATLHVTQAGPADGPIALLLHGFPEFWYGWRHQIGPLVEAGYRVWAPDQRGYNISDKPAEVRAYQIDRLTADIAALIQASGRD